ncbi:MAG: hypothetical protein ABL884_12425 [Methyloglobulus sp.]
MAWKQIEETLKEFINTVKDQWIWFIDDQIDVLQGKRHHFCGKKQIANMTDSDESEKRLADWQNQQREKIRSKRTSVG